jgi:hypothetical protein
VADVEHQIVARVEDAVDAERHFFSVTQSESERKFTYLGTNPLLQPSVNRRFKPDSVVYHGL